MAEYKVGQFCQAEAEGDNKYSTPVCTELDKGICGSETYPGSSKKVQYIRFNNITFTNDKIYYLRLGIKKYNVIRKFNIYLVDKNDNIHEYEQFLDSVIIEPSASDEVQDVEIIFNPLALPRGSFNKIIIKQESYNNNLDGGSIVILYKDLDILNNIIGNQDGIPGTLLVKMGIQANPSTNFCINGEMIKIGNSSLYEINDDNIKVNFISAANAGKFPEIVVPSQSTSYLWPPLEKNIKPFVIDYLSEI